MQVYVAEVYAIDEDGGPLLYDRRRIEAIDTDDATSKANCWVDTARIARKATHLRVRLGPAVIYQRARSARWLKVC
jgi:hypothetical protein